MTENLTPEDQTELDEETARHNSKKRQFIATAAAGAVTVVLGLAATALIEKFSKRVKDQIAPPETDPDTEDK